MSTEGINLLLVIVSLLVILVVAATFLVAMSNNATVSRRVRTKLIGRFRRAPLYRMLKARHVDVVQYELETPQQAIEHQLQFCDTCSHKKQCEKMLRNSPHADDDYAFCPNAEIIERLTDGESA